MITKHGRMATDRADRYAKQLASHWSKKTDQKLTGGAIVLAFESGNVVVLRPLAESLEVEVEVPDGADVDRFAQVVAEHLRRFGHRDELAVEWS